MIYRIGSWLLVVAAGALVLWFLWSASQFDSVSAPETAPPATAREPGEGQVRIDQSTLLTAYKENRPFLVKAARAVQKESEPEQVELETVAGEISREDGKLNFKSDRAVYDSKSGDIHLMGNVRIVSPSTFEASLEDAHVSLTDKNLRSSNPVTVVFDGGTIDAGGVDVENDGMKIVFKNRVRAVIRENPKADKAP